MAEETSPQASSHGSVTNKKRGLLKILHQLRSKDEEVPAMTVVAKEAWKGKGKEHAPSKQLQYCEDLEIRLVHLQPRSISGDRVQCHLTIQRLVSDSYEALSYEWGIDWKLPEREEITINMDGVDIPVRENLWWALRYLQLDDEPRTLWIDALCINQTDTEERSYQVSRMDYIYHSATRCIAWLGKTEIGPGLEVEDCELAMNFIKKAALAEGKKSYPTILSGQDTDEHDSFELLCRRKYWTRLWIIQEVLLSKNVQVQYGSHSVSWSALRYVFTNLKVCVHPSYQFSIASSAPFRLHQASSLDVGTGRASDSSNLAGLILLFRESLCEDPRDTVFGLLGLTSDCCRNEVAVDYSTTPEHLCITLLLHHMSYHVDLKISSPDFTADIRDICFTITRKSEVTQELLHSIASLSIKARHSARPAPKVLKVDRGRVILVMAAVDLQKALRAPRVVDFHSHSRSAANPTPYTQHPQHIDEKSLDMRDIVLNKLLKKSRSSIFRHRHYGDETSNWEQQRYSLSQIAKKIPSGVHLTQIFLTDTGYSGITTSETKLGDTATSKTKSDLKTTFEDENSGPHFHSGKPKRGYGYGISLDSATTFQELLSWVE